MEKKFYVSVLTIIVLVALGVLVYHLGVREQSTTSTTTPTTTTGGLINDVTYSCDAGKTIEAKYYPREVDLSLSDGRTETLKQTISADGGRYSDGDPNVQGSESFVFWSKGNGAMVLENNQEKSFTGCIVLAPLPAGSNLTQTYSNGTVGFSIRLPEGFTPNASYVYQALGPGKDIHGVKFTIPASLAAGTNLSTDSYISVESIPQTQNCSAALFTSSDAKVSTVSENGTDYSYAATNGAAAGNRYDEFVYALPGTNPCLAVRYFIHYGVIDNYPPGTVKQFDETSLKNTFDAIRRTLVIQ